MSKSKKFIPNDDPGFAEMAERFARAIAKDPARFLVAQQDSDALVAAVEKFRAVLNARRFSGSGISGAKPIKDEARREAEQRVRHLNNLIKPNKNIELAAKVELGLRLRSGKAGRPIPCPQQPPRLQFVRAHHESAATPRHELKFSALDYSRSKPEGAVRLELFVDLIPPEEPVLEHPFANQGVRLWYWRSYTKSPIVLVPPMTRVPMRVLYWGRWADSTGEVGPFSRTAAGWIEGGTKWGLPGGPEMVLTSLGGRKATPILENATVLGPAGRDHTYVVAIREAREQALLCGNVAAPPQLPAPTQGEADELEEPEKEAA